MESVLWSVWTDFSVVLTHSLPGHDFLSLLQKYIQNTIKHTKVY